MSIIGYRRAWVYVREVVRPDKLPPEALATARRVGDNLVQQELVYEKLPADIAERHVLLMDPILATGNSAARAVQVCPLRHMH